MSDFDLNAFLPYQLAVLASRTSRQFEARYRARFGLSIPEWRVMAHLSQTDHPVSVREIHMRVDMDKSKVSRAATRLEEAGLIEKTVNAQDRRLISLSLTEKGRQMMDAIIPIAHAFEADLLSRLPAHQAAAFRKAVDLLLRGGT